MESYKDTGIVLSANWICTDSQNDITVKRSGQSIFNEPSDSPIPYDELTEEIVLNWVWVDGGVDKTLVEESVTQELQGLINPTIIKNPLPWA
jgi:hypothetical protein